MDEDIKRVSELLKSKCGLSDNRSIEVAADMVRRYGPNVDQIHLVEDDPKGK